MDNVIFFISKLDGAEIALIDHGNEQYTSMLKSTYEAQQAQAALSTPNV